MTDATKKKDTRFRPGESGNPGGRPSTGMAKIRADLAEAWEGIHGQDGIKEALLKKAREGDMAAIRIVAERVCPAMKAMEPATPLQMPEGSLTDKGNAVLAALVTGTLNTSQAAQLLQALGALAKVIETDDLAKRIEALEAAKGK